MKTILLNSSRSVLDASKRAPALGRERLFLWLMLAASLNSVVGPAIRSVLQHGAANSIFNLFGLSAIVWIGFLAGLSILSARDGDGAAPLDYGVAAVAALLVLLPMATASSLAIALIAIYGIATGGPGSNLRRASIIFLSISVSLFWGRLFLALFSRSLLHIDAFFVTNLFGAEQVGNQVSFIDQSRGGFVVAPGCSSLQGMSLAFVFWATVTQWYRVSLNFKSLLWCFVAVLATLAINVARLGAIAHFPDHFDAIHTGWGWHVASWMTMAAVVSIIVYGARREIFDRS